MTNEKNVQVTTRPQIDDLLFKSISRDTMYQICTEVHRICQFFHAMAIWKTQTKMQTHLNIDLYKYLIFDM